jgi:hypothetical protein
VYRYQLSRVIGTLVIPQGYTLSIAGSFAAAVFHFGYPSYGQALGFVGGALLAFVLLAATTVRRASGQAADTLPELPLGPRALFNVVALAAVPLAAGTCWAIPWPALGFPAAGLIGAGGYALLVAGYLALAQKPRLPRATHRAPRNGPASGS